MGVSRMQTTLVVKLGRAVRKLRIKKNISQEEFAALCNLHRTYISDIELGKRNLSIENVERIAEALGISVSGLFIEAENESI